MIRCLFLLATLLVASCQTQNMTNSTAPNHNSRATSSQHATAKAHRSSHIKATEQDGPPPGPPPSKFGKVVPTKESMSRYGNPSAYKVNGRTYEVMTTAKGYKERGLASWYGTKFHSKRTSSGKHYDLYGMTAAHKTLPLPTYVKVTNLNNGRSIIVKVIDRGPFHQGRIIDLSYGAAAKLGYLPTGTAPVEVEAINTGHHEAHYYIQAGAFSTRALADELRGKIKKMTTSPVTIERYKQFYIVKMGPFANKRASDTMRAILTNKGVKGAFTVLL